MQNNQLFEQISQKSVEVFCNPKVTYPYYNIITGCTVKGRFTTETMFAVAKNTWRGFHTINKSADGASVVFKEYFTKNQQLIIANLKSVISQKEMHNLEHKICIDLRSNLTNIKPQQLSSYNKIRKPVDLYIEHIVSMANELEGHRERLVKLLFLPLDSQMFQSAYIFTDYELGKCGLKRSSTFTNLESRPNYLALQNMLSEKAKNITSMIQREFYPIFFDLLWNDRYKKDGANLFETNI